MSSQVKYMLPKAENLLRFVNANIVRNRKKRREARVNLPALIERAYLIVNETGVIPYQENQEEETTNG